MLFTCTPGQLVAHVLGTLAVSQNGLSLPQLWLVALAKTQSTELDNFQKNVVWQSLVGGTALLIAIKAGELDVAASSDLTYGSLLLHGTELEIFLLPTEECQFRYLTGTENYHTMKAHLGELPFQLLIVVARHGKKGILNLDLAKESGQDARSLRVRLQKLELSGLVVTRNVYVNKKHTTHTVHVKFAEDTVVVRDSSELELDLDASRDVGKLKKHIMEAIKAAPNQLRGFSDLRKELKLDGSHSASKFFRSVCLKLHRSGYIEKLHVELPETRQRLYAIRFVKDIPKEAEELSEFVDVNDVNGLEDDESDAEEDLPTQDSPVFNQVFPVFHQIFQQIYARGEKGITSGEVAKNLLGVSEYRPYTRLYETLPSYLSNGKTLKASKKYADPYEECTVSKLYDNEGKLKFYRYFVKEFCKEEKPQPKAKAKQKVSKDSIVVLNKKLHSTLGKSSRDSLIEKKRRIVQLSDQPLKKLKTPKEKLPDLLVEPELEEASRRRTRDKPQKTYAGEDLMEIDAHSADEYVPEQVAAILGSTSALSFTDLPTFVAPPRDNKKKRSLAQTYKTEGSAKSMNRRNLLLDLIREEGGATYSSSSLCRKLDERMGNSTLTDVKTLARDVIHLTKTRQLELQKVAVEIAGQPTEKKLLVLTNPLDRPTPEKLEELRATYAEFRSKKDMKIFTRRIIQSEMKLYVETPSTKKVSTGTRRRRGKNRLLALGDEDEDGAPEVKSEPPEEVPATPEPGDIMSQLKRSRRARKVHASSLVEASLSTAKRPRRNIKLEKSEATLLYRSVVISKAFTREAIDFEYISTFFADLDGKIVKQKWGTLRRLYGGAEAVSKGVETFQNMVMQAIEDGVIEESHLAGGDLKFFLNFWKEFDTNTEFAVVDDMPLFSSFEKNLTEYNFVKGTEINQVGSHYERIEDISMRQKESMLSQSVFAYEADQKPVEKDHDELRSVLKAIFSTKEENFDPQMVKTILNKYGEAAVRETTDALLHDREILYISLDANTRFVLSDKFNNSLILRIFTPKFFNQATAFKDTLTSLSSAGKGLIVSQGIMPGEMAALLELISDNFAELIRIDRALRFENYESRLIDKEQIACDIVIRCKSDEVQKIQHAVEPIPFNGPCSPIWIDLNAEVNRTLWTKIVVTILYYVVLKPGITDGGIYERVNVVLGLQDFKEVMDWLVKSQCIVKYKCDGYLATDRWQYILGA